MILSTSTKEKIIDIRDYYEKRNQLVDVNFINEILITIQKEEAFKQSLKYKFVDEKKGRVAFTEFGIMYFHIDLFMKYIKINVKDWFSDFSDKNMSKYCNFIALLIIFHECSHSWQQNGLEMYSEINRLHHDTSCLRRFPLKEILKAIRLQINLLRINEHAYFERQANIDALRELVDMYQGYEFLNFIELQHIYNLSFKPKGESIVHDTLKKYLLEYNYNCEGIPQNLLFEVGLPTDKVYSETIYDAIDKYNNEELSYERVIEKIKKY